MAHDFKRTDRIAESILRKLGTVIGQESIELGLPRFVTLSAVKVTRDLGHAKIYFTVLQDDPLKTAKKLNGSAGHFRTILAKSMTLRTVPQLHFVYDESVEYAKYLNHLIDEVNPVLPEDVAE